MTILEKFKKNNKQWSITDIILQDDDSYIDGLGNQLWVNDAGHFHREDGPALIRKNKFTNPIEPEKQDLVWILENVAYTFEDWSKELNLSEEWDTYYRLVYPA